MKKQRCSLFLKCKSSTTGITVTLRDVAFHSLQTQSFADFFMKTNNLELAIITMILQELEI